MCLCFMFSLCSFFHILIIVIVYEINYFSIIIVQPPPRKFMEPQNVG